MTDTYQAEVAQIAARCKSVGWPVTMAKTRRQAWLYRIALPDSDAPLELMKERPHNGWRDAVLRVLDAAGLDDAERRAKADREKADPTSATLALADAVFAPGEATSGKANGAKQDPHAKALALAAGPLQWPPLEVDLNWLLTPTNIPQVRFVTVTPRAAQQVLERNVRNRKKRPRRVQRFADQLRDGQFGATHQGGAIDEDGVVQDGQKRLQAIVDTGVPAIMQWTIGQPRDYFQKVDIGEIRSAADTAYTMGEKDETIIAPAARMLVIIERWAGDAHLRDRSSMDNDQIADAIEKYAAPLREAISEAKALRRALKKANTIGLAVAICQIRRRLRKDDPRVDAFFRGVETGDMIPGASPQMALRNVLMNGRADGRSYLRWETAAFVLKAWNKAAAGERVKNALQWRRNEAFPAAVFLPPRDRPGEMHDAR